MEDVIVDALKSGEIVRLGDLDTLQIGVSGKGEAGRRRIFFSHPESLYQLSAGRGSFRYAYHADVYQSAEKGGSCEDRKVRRCYLEQIKRGNTILIVASFLVYVVKTS